MHYYRFPPARDFYYTVRKALGRERHNRDLSHICTACRTTDGDHFFRRDKFLKENGFRPDVAWSFVNHHAAHALAALFHTDWPDALIYTADGIGDDVAYSARTARSGELALLFGGDENLNLPIKVSSVGLPYNFFTEALGFIPNRA